MNSKKKNGDLITISGNYHYNASILKKKIKKFWYYTKKTIINRFLLPKAGYRVLNIGSNLIAVFEK